MAQVSLSTSTNFNGDLNALVEDQGTSLTVRFDLDEPTPAGGLNVYIDSDIEQILNRLDLPGAIANPQFENLNLAATQTNFDNSGLAVSITEGSTFATLTLNIFDNEEPDTFLPETFDGLVEATLSLVTADQVAPDDQNAITGVSDYTIDPNAASSVVLFADDVSQLADAPEPPPEPPTPEPPTEPTPEPPSGPQVSNITPIAGEFSDFYATQNLGRIPLDTGDFIPLGYGAITFLDDDTLLVGGSPYTADAAIYSVDVTRDPDTNSITGFAAPATFLANAPGSADPDTVLGGLDGGLIVAPNGTLLYTAYEDNTIGQILPGNTEPEPDAFIDLTALGVEISTGAFQIVPEGISGEGRLKITSFDGGIFYDALLTPNEDGITYSVSLGEESVTFGDADDGGIRGTDAFVYLDESYPGFTSDSVLIAEYFAQDISVFEVDDIGNPILETARVFVDDFDASGGFVFGTTIDPVTGDILVSLDSGFP
ncbi:MAG: hypothetical protein AAGD25_37340, partial [Cyanobacteria bacterium P01_F01_bin.150]